MARQPVYEVRFGLIKACVWLNNTKSGPRHNVTIHRVYRNGDLWKESSHFLRNIGYRGLAILDRHILKNLHRHGVISAVPQAMTRNTYLSIEHRFFRFAEHLGVSIDELDLLFWSRETGKILK